MINVLRKNQKALWIVIGVLCIPFVFYFVQRPDYARALHSQQLGSVYDHPVSQLELQHSARLFNLARELGMFTLLQDMVAGAQTENDAYVDFTFNRLVLQHEAERLGIEPSRQEIINLVKSLRPFHGDKGFDPAKYDNFTQTVLPSMGFNESHVEELAADQLVLQQIKDLIGMGVQVPETETRENYERGYGKLSVAVVRVRSDQFAQGIQISDDDVAKYFEAHKAELNTDEKRKVSFVTFALNDEQKKLTGKERVEVLQKLADRANDFSQALLEKGAEFDQVAAKFEAPVQMTGDFTKSAPDPKLNANPQLATAAFQVSPNEPNSDAVQVADGFYILHLASIEPARPLTLEEAKPKIVETLRKDRTREMVATRGAEAVSKIRDALKSGTPVDGAISAAGLPVEKLPPFGLADPPKMKPAEPGKPEPEPEPVDMNTIKGAVAELNPGETSEFVPTEGGGLVAVVEKRDPPDPAAYEAVKGMFSARVAHARRDGAFYDWLRERRREAGVPETPALKAG